MKSASIRPAKGKNLSEALDAIDSKILDLIQRDAALSVAEIAERVGLSSSPCWRRIKRLEDAGVILRRVTILDGERLGLGFEVYCTVKLSLPTKQNSRRSSARSWPGRRWSSAPRSTGSADYELRIVTRDMAAFDELLREKCCRWAWSRTSKGRIVIRGVKNTTAVPLA